MPTPAPCLQGTKNIDLLFYAQDLELALQRANADKATLRRYFDEVSNNDRP